MFLFKKKQDTENKVSSSDEAKAKVQQAQTTQNQNSATPLEESWHFLKNISLFVYSKLSKNQQDEIIEKGRKIMSAGAKYTHIIYGSIEHKDKKK